MRSSFDSGPWKNSKTFIQHERDISNTASYIELKSFFSSGKWQNDEEVEESEKREINANTISKFKTISEAS